MSKEQATGSDSGKGNGGRGRVRFVVVVSTAFLVGTAFSIAAWVGLSWYFLPAAFHGNSPRLAAAAAKLIRWLLAPGFLWNRADRFGGPAATLFCAGMTWGALWAGAVGTVMFFRERPADSSGS